MVVLRFDCRDLLKSARLAFSFQRLWIQFLGLSVGYLAYVLLTYLSLLAAGHNLGTLWSSYGLLPSALGNPLPWFSWILFGLGVAVLVFSWLVTATGVARATYMHLKGNTFYTWKQAFRFALNKKGGSVVSTPIAVLFIALFLVLGGVIVGLLGRIPYLGELGVSLFSVVWYLTSLFLVFVIVVLGVSLLVTPAVLATTDDDAFEGIFQSFSLLYSQPWRLILYHLFVVVIAIVSFGVFAFFAKKAWGVMTTVLVWGMGEKYGDLSYAASGLVQNWVYPAVVWSRTILGDASSFFFFTRDFSSIPLPVVMTAASWIFAVLLVVIGTFVLSYPLAVFNAGSTLAFLILKKKKDDENLLERKDKEEEEDLQTSDEEKKEEEKVEKMTEEGAKPSFPQTAPAKKAVRKPAVKKTPKKTKPASKSRKKPAKKR